MDTDTAAPVLTSAVGRQSVGRWHSAVLIAVNVLGVLLYLRLASAAWAIPQERAAGINTVTGEPFVWAISVFPVSGTFLLANVAVAIVSRRRGRRINTLSWLVIVGVWVIAVAVDFTHH